MNNMNRFSTMPEISPEITDEAIIEALFAQRPYEEKVINSAFLEIPADYQRGLSIPNVEKMSAEFTELIANPPKVSYRDGHYFVFDGQHTIVAAVQRKIDAHAQLCALLAGAGLGQQGIDAVQLQGVQLHAAVGRAAVADDDIAQGIYPGGLGAAQLGQNTRSLVDNGDQQAVITALGQQLGGAVIRHALQGLAFIFDHWNTSAT